MRCHNSILPKIKNQCDIRHILCDKRHKSMWYSSQNDVICVTFLFQKNSEILSINIHPHTRFGGWGFCRFAGSGLASRSLTLRIRRNHTNWRWKLESETRKRENPVLFVVKMKIRDVRNAEWRKVQLWFFICLFLLYTLTQCKKNPQF